jgi:hypothetical protein
MRFLSCWFFACPNGEFALHILLFREKKLHLEAQLPVGATPLRCHHVVKSLELKIDRQLATQLDNFAEPCANRQCPTVVAGGQPVCRDDRRTGHVPAIGEVVVNKRLDEQCVDVVFAPSRIRPLVVRQRSDHPVSRHSQQHQRRPASHLPLPSTEAVAVGNVSVGPTPQISLPEFAGERNRLGLMSPSPKALGIPGQPQPILFYMTFIV